MPNEIAAEIKSILADNAKQAQTALDAVTAENKKLDGHIAEIDRKIQAHGVALAENKDAFTSQVAKLQEAETNLDKVASRLSKMGGADVAKSLGQLVAESPATKAYQGGSATLLTVGRSLFHKDITDASGSGAALVVPYTAPGISHEPEQPLTIRDLLVTIQTMQGAIQWAREDTYTNAAATRADGVAAAESNLVFSMQNSPVQIISHWFAVSMMLMSDVPGLGSYIDNRGRYGLALEEEKQLLLGDGVGTNLAGLYTSATDYDTLADVAGDKKLDMLRRAILQVTQSNYTADGVVLNPADWCDIELTKTSEGAYVFANPANALTPRVWGKPVVESMSMTQLEFLAASFQQSATLWDRMETTVRVADQHASFAIAGMAALIFDERLALTIERPLGLVKGTLADTPIV